MASPGSNSVVHHLWQWAAGQQTAAASDQQLLERFVAGQDEDAFTALVHRHGPMVFGVCRRLLRETHDTEDAFQATFMVLARKAASIHKGDSLGSWLHGVALHVAHGSRREAVRRTRRERERPAPTVSETADAVTWGELRSVLDEELGRLPAPWRAPLILCYLEGQTQDEAARRLGWSKSTLRRRLERGRGLLRSRLARRGVTLSAGLLAPLLCDSNASAVAAKMLTATTAKTALLFATGQMIGTATMPPVALAEGVLKSIVLAKTRLAAAVVLTLTLFAGAGLWAYQAVTQKAPQVKSAEPPASVADRNEAKSIENPQAAVDQFGDPLPADALARLGTIRLQHGSVASALAFAPDGRSLATAGNDGVVHVWETVTGKEKLRIENERYPGGLGAVFSLSYAPDGKTLAGSRINQPVCVWDVATGKEIRQFGGDDWRDNRAYWVVFSPDGKTLAYDGQENRTIRLAEVSTGRELHRFKGRNGYAVRAAYSPDGGTLATAEEQTIHLFDVVTGKRRELPLTDGPSASVTGLSFSRDGKTLEATSHGNKLIRLVDVATGKVLRTITLTGKREEIRSVLFSRDGQTLISGHEDGYVRFWDVATGRKTRQFRAHSYSIIAVALSPDEETLATSSNSGIDGEHAVRMWETATGKPLVRHPGPEQGIARVVFSPDSRQVATASWEGAIHLWEASTGKLLHHWQAFGLLAFTPDRKSLIYGGWEDGRIHVLDLATAKETRQFTAHVRGVHDMCLSRDGTTLVTTGGDGLLRLWDFVTGKQVQQFGGKSFVHRLALSPDARVLASIHENKTIRLWETATGKLLREHPESDYVGSIAFSPDSTLMASSFMGDLGRNPLIRLREVATGKEVGQLRGDAADPMDTMAFSPDGRTLIWGGQHRRELYLWEIATRQLRRKFSGHQGHLTCMAFSPDGRMMASGSSDASALIWDVTGRGARHQPPRPCTIPQLNNLWSDLAATDAAVGYRAICNLRASPRQALPLFEQHLGPVPAPDAKRLAQALRNLDSDQFTLRQQATKELEQMGEAAEMSLRQVLAEKPSLEVRQRVAMLLARLEGAEQLRQMRSLEVLEQAGDSESRRLLTALARGAPQARLTREVQAALDRMGGQRRD
jgi:RNA polymerase sigma factor (sigma-70 family)